MAKKRLSNENPLKVYTIAELVNASPAKVKSMSKAELKQAVQRLAMESNKRLAGFKRQGITSPATSFIRRHGGKFSAKKYKSVIGLRNEYQRAVGYLKTETGTLKGFREWETRVAKTLKDNTGIDYNSLTDTQKKTFWKAYAKLEELDEANVYNQRYKSSVNEIYTAVKGGLKAKDITKFATDLNDRIYAEDNTNLLEGENDPFNLIDIDNSNPFLS